MTVTGLLPARTIKTRYITPKRGFLKQSHLADAVLVVKYGTAVERFRYCELMPHHSIEICFRLQTLLYDFHKSIQSAHTVCLLIAFELRGIERTAEYANRFIVSLERHGERVAILAAERERKSRRIGKTHRHSVYNLRHERKRLHCAGAEILRKQQVRKAVQLSFVSDGEHRTQTLEIHVFGAHIMMPGHFQMPDCTQRDVRVLARNCEQRLPAGCAPASTRFINVP